MAVLIALEAREVIGESGMEFAADMSELPVFFFPVVCIVLIGCGESTAPYKVFLCEVFTRLIGYNFIARELKSKSGIGLEFCIPSLYHGDSESR